MSTLLATLAFAMISSPQGSAPAQPAALVPQPLMREIPGMEMPFVSLFPPGYRPCDINDDHLVVDIDGDGDLDVLVAPNAARGMRLFFNDGRGRFTEVTSTHVSAMFPTPRYTPNICAGDIDGDGDLDIVGGTNTGSYGPRYIQGVVYINDGTTHFQDDSYARLPTLQAYWYFKNHATALADFDGDGDLDLVLGGDPPRASDDRSIRLLRNDGLGFFTYDPSATPVDYGAGSSFRGGLESVDIDHDGDIDLIGNALHAAGITLWINDGSGRFTDARSTHVHAASFPYSTDSISVGDFDGDGFVDVAATPGGVRTALALLLNDGTGHFFEVGQTHMDQRVLGDILVRSGDFDGDGDLDLIAPLQTFSWNYPGGEQLLLNDGTGHFTLDVDHRIFLPHPNGGVWEVAVGDFDGDGDGDALIPDGGTLPYATCRTRYLLNTTRHVWAEDRPTRGSNWHINLTADPGSVAALAFSPLAGSTPVPPFGTLGLDPGSTLIWPSLASIGNDRNGYVNLPIPALAILQGMSLYIQALMVEPNGRARFSNVWVEDAIR